MEGKKRTLLMAALFLAVGVIYFAATELMGGRDETQEPARDAAETAEPADSPGEADGAEEDGAGETGPARSPNARTALRQEAVIRGERYEATIDNLGGGISHFRLVGDARYTEAGAPIDVITTDREEYQALRVELARLGIPDDIVWESEQVSEREVRLSWEGRGLRLERTFSAGDGPYQIWSSLEATNTSTRPKRTRLEVAVHHYVRRSDESGGFFGFGARSPKISQGTCVYGEETERIDRGKLAPDGERPLPHGYGAGDVQLAAVENVYFVQAMAAHEESAQRCSLLGSNRGGTPGEPDGTLLETRLVYPWETIEPGASRTWRTLGYLGPKEPSTLHAAGHSLPEVVDLGFFALIAAQLARLLSFIHDYVPNWGVAIILLTLLIRLVLFPLTNLSFKSMARMRQLKPEIDRVNQLYANDAEKKGAAVMELYRKHKINPLSGCLPMVLQLPVWWALYTSLSTNIELYHMPFTLWWTDLSAPDAYFVLPLALGALMHVQQRMTPTTADPMQAKMMMWFMPIMITVFMLFLPSGLCLYMLTNSALGIGQQKYNEVRLRKQAPLAPTGGAPASKGPDDDGDDDDVSQNEPRRTLKRKRVRRARRG